MPYASSEGARSRSSTARAPARSSTWAKVGRAAERGRWREPETSATGGVEIARTGKRLKEIENDLGTLEERWLELTDQIETATA